MLLKVVMLLIELFYVEQTVLAGILQTFSRSILPIYMRQSCILIFERTIKLGVHTQRTWLEL